jgi:hypothetical protein
MSYGTTRARIVTALSTVANVTGHPYPPAIMKAGDGWPLLASLDSGPGQSWQATWRILIVLGGTERDAIDKIDALTPALFDALDPILFIDSASPVTISTSAGDLPGLQINARSE